MTVRPFSFHNNRKIYNRCNFQLLAKAWIKRLIHNFHWQIVKDNAKIFNKKTINLNLYLVSTTMGGK